MIHSKRLEEILGTRTRAASDNADSSCTGGYDNDGSTGKEIFENGVALGIAAAKSGKEIFWASVENDDCWQVCHFLLASSEDEACETAAAWEEDVEEEGV